MSSTAASAIRRGGKIAGGCVQTPSSLRSRCRECGRGWERLPVSAAGR